MFKSSSQRIKSEREKRLGLKYKLLSFGVNVLDEMLLGIFPDDLVLIGAPSGVGKTQFCCILALANVLKGKKVHFLALEASKYEIERRLKYQLIAKSFFDPKNTARPKLPKRLSYARWLVGEFDGLLEEYEERAEETIAEKFANLFTFYKSDSFNVQNLVETVLSIANETDLIIIDHAHYFDFENDNENAAIREIAKTARTLALENSKPIILVAHLRKKDRRSAELVAGLDEFHGSSDLFKVATRVITLAPGKPISDGGYETFIRVPKDRLSGESTKYIARLEFNAKKNAYEELYRLGSPFSTAEDGFVELDRDHYPDWTKRPAIPSRDYSSLPNEFQRRTGAAESQGRPGSLQGYQADD